MTKVIKEEFEKPEFQKISDDSFTCNTSLEIFHKEFNRMSIMDDDLFTYKVEISGLANVPCDLNEEDDSEQQMTHESGDDMEYDPSNARGDNEVELTDEESSSSEDEDEVAEIFKIDTNVFDFETPMCRAFKKINYLLQIDPDVLTKNIKKDDRCCNGGNLLGAYIVGNTLRFQDLEWYEALKDSKIKEEALKNKASIEGIIKEDDESSNEDEERCELFDDHERPVCNIRIFEMIKYSFGENKEYVAIREHEYDDLTSTNEDTCRTYQEIFCRMDEGWMVTRAE
ncbi:hypothetical protein Tco_1073699 [Tanacetum coccineum]